jgi:NAD(P)-dependent dehydrogenase (short-subunit alcohol dehydrogenase family)
MTPQTVLITGATDGVGRYVALELARAGARILIHGRNRQRADQLMDQIRGEGHDRVTFYPADFASLQAVRDLGQRVLGDVSQLDLLINNAGIFTGPPGTPRQMTDDGLEMRLAVNYAATVQLTRLLLPLLGKSRPARIVNVASLGQQEIDFSDLMLSREYSGLRAYRQSKLALIMFTIDLAQELAGTGVTVNSVHPATFMDTQRVRESGIAPRSTVEDGGRAILHVATAPALAAVSGQFFDGTVPARALAQAYDPQAREQLRRLTGPWITRPASHGYQGLGPAELK